MTVACPQCNQPGVPVSSAALDTHLSEQTRNSLALTPTPARRRSGGLGCVTLALSFAISVFVSVVVGGIAEYTNGTNFPAQGMRLGETGVFSGIAAFIVVMTAMFSFFVWRQARMDTLYTKQVSQWHSQKSAYEADYYCVHCNMRWTPPAH